MAHGPCGVCESCRRGVPHCDANGWPAPPPAEERPCRLVSEPVLACPKCHRSWEVCETVAADLTARLAPAESPAPAPSNVQRRIRLLIENVSDLEDDDEDCIPALRERASALIEDMAPAESPAVPVHEVERLVADAKYNENGGRFTGRDGTVAARWFLMRLRALCSASRGTTR